MTVATFKLPIGNKCQVTIPRQCMGLLSLSVGDELLLEVEGDRAVLHPLVSVPRSELPEELWKKFAARRGAKPEDIPLGNLLEEVGYQPRKAAQRKRKPARAAHGKAPGGTQARQRAAGDMPSVAASSEA